MPKVKVSAPTVRITVFNTTFFKNAAHNGRVLWNDATSGKIVKRNKAGRFFSVPFTVAQQAWNTQLRNM